MSETESKAEAHIAPTSAEVLAILGQILALPEQQRTALARSWAALDGSIAGEYSQSYYKADHHVQQPSVADQNAIAELNEWIQAQSSLQPRERIDRLELAMANETEEWPIPVLWAEITKIKNAHPWLAAELAVVKYAYEHPVLITVALFGVGLSLYQIGKTVFSLVF